MSSSPWTAFTQRSSNGDDVLARADAPSLVICCRCLQTGQVIRQRKTLCPVRPTLAVLKRELLVEPILMPGGRTMEEYSEVFVGLDVAKDRHAVGQIDLPRFLNGKADKRARLAESRPLPGGWLIDFGVASAVSPPSPLCGRSSPLVPDEAGKIVGKVGHADLRPGAGDADGAHEQAHPGFLLREDVFDEGAGFRSPPIGPRRRLAHRPTLRFLLMDVTDVAVLLQPLLVLFRAIGRVGPDSRTGVGAVEDIAKLRAAS